MGILREMPLFFQFPFEVTKIEQGKDKPHGKSGRKQERNAEITAYGFRKLAHDGGAGKATDITRQSQQSEHGNAAVWQKSRRRAEPARPHDSHGKTADGATHHGNDGIGGKGYQKEAGKAGNAADDHGFSKADLGAEFGVENTGTAH